MMQTAEKPVGNPLSSPTTYTVKGREFIVEPVYKEQAHESMGEILLKVMMAGDGENHEQD